MHIPNRRQFLLASAGVLALPTQGHAASSLYSGGNDALIPSARPFYEPWGFDLTAIDNSVSPGDDFFKFANGAWERRTDIPPDKFNYGLFDELQERVQDQLRTLIEYKADVPHANTTKIHHFYQSYMDEARIDALEATPLDPLMAELRAVTTKDQIAQMMGASHSGFGASVFRLSVSPDDQNPDVYALAIRQSGLSLRSRDYYLEPAFATNRAQLRRYAEELLVRLQWPFSKQRADEIVLFETRLAEASWSILESQQLENMYHPTSRSELEGTVPNFPWASWLSGAGVGGIENLIVRQNTALPLIASVFTGTDLETLKAWQAFRIADSAAPFLSTGFMQAHFGFRNRDLLGQQEDRPRWRKGVDLISQSLGEIVSQTYVLRYFPQASKTTMVSLVAQLKSAFRERVEQASWMTSQTKREALRKLSLMGQKLGYPDKWRDFDALRIDPLDLIGNVARSEEFEWAFQRDRIGQRVDVLDWDVTAQTVNAFYDEKRNEIVVPAAILQPPFFDPNADMAVNFGGIGAVIAHEMTHSLDNQGRKTDAEGRLRDWWDPQDAAAFSERANRLAAQFDTYQVGPSAFVNGQRTMSENVADLGAVEIALDAYRQSLGGRRAPTFDGFTGEQRLFLGWAQILRAKIRPEALVNQATVDPHSPDRFRAIGPLRNIDRWYAAWSVRPGQLNYLPPEQRVSIW